MKKILIFGATSAIAEATARLWAAEAACFFLVARHEEKLALIASDLQVRGAGGTQYQLLDLNSTEQHRNVIERAANVMDGIDIALIAHGTLGDQKRSEEDFRVALAEFQTNALSVVSLLTHLAQYFEGRRAGTIAVISSVAGDRGRQSNYVYGSAKGAVTIFLQGLRNRLHKSGIQVLTIKPGFVDTPMTARFKKGPLWVTPGRIAQCIKSSVEKGKDEVYAPGFWLIIMAIVKAVPERIFKRMKL